MDVAEQAQGEAAAVKAELDRLKQVRSWCCGAAHHVLHSTKSYGTHLLMVCDYRQRPTPSSRCSSSMQRCSGGWEQSMRSCGPAST